MPSFIGTNNDDIKSYAGSDLRYSMSGRGGNDELTGGNKNDLLSGGLDNDLLNGEGGNDNLSGGLGDDTLNGGDGDDAMTAGIGNDVLNGGEGDDLMRASIGDDLLFGDGGNDNLGGSVGSDVLFGGDGDDILNGGTNGAIDAPPGFFEDYLIGGAGADVLNGFGGGLGTTEIDWLIGGGAVDNFGFITSIAGDGVEDIFVLGNADIPFYVSDGLNDYARIFGFESGVDKIVVNSAVGYQVAEFDLFNDGIADTLLLGTFSDGSSELISVFDNGVPLSGADFIFV